MRRVSVRSARLAMDKKLWKWIRFSAKQLFRDKRHFTGRGRRKTVLMNLQGLSGEDLSWLVCRVAEVTKIYYGPGSTAYRASEFNEVLRGIIWEAGEGTSQLRKLRCILLENQDGLDNELLDGAVARIKSVDLNHAHLTT